MHYQSEIYADIIDELNAAKKKYPSWPDDMVHCAAIVNEESGELTRAVLNHVYHGDDIEHVRREAIQTAAMAIRFLEELGHQMVPKEIKSCDTCIHSKNVCNHSDSRNCHSLDHDLWSGK